MKCPDCKGNGRIVLLITAVECERCNSTGMIANVSISSLATLAPTRTDPYVEPSGPVRWPGDYADGTYADGEEREPLLNPGAPKPPAIKTTNLDALMCDESHHARSRNFSYARAEALIGAVRHMLIVGNS